jgi:hypothetical protein
MSRRFFECFGWSLVLFSILGFAATALADDPGIGTPAKCRRMVQGSTAYCLKYSSFTDPDACDSVQNCNCDE